jgi:uncharacterized protein involved in type VI secretion and phage assembly
MSFPDQSNGANPQRYYGKYRGTVVANNDPQQTGRVLVTVADVLGTTSSSWATPSMAGAGAQAGCFIVPPVGSQVWVEFEQGDPDYPILAGSFWGSTGDVPTCANTPAAPPSGQNIVLQTTGGNMVLLSDAPATSSTGGIVIKSGSAMIVVNSTGIYIDNGNGAVITLLGSSVDINSGGLTIT